MMVRHPKAGLGHGLNGAWLLLVVATESITVLGALVADHLETTRNVVLFFMLATYLLGAMLYVILISLIFQRLAFLPLPTDALTPPYWINMGALAMTTLAGATLMLKADEWALLREARPFLIGFTLLFWVTGNWWIPLLAILGAWRHAVRRVPVAYDTQYWCLVFPLGMYAAGTFQLATALGLPFLLFIPRVFVWIALTAWILTSIGLVRRLVGHSVALAAADARS
jgi:tellurite resistance protein TehA-like permease